MDLWDWKTGPTGQHALFCCSIPPLASHNDTHFPFPTFAKSFMDSICEQWDCSQLKDVSFVTCSLFFHVLASWQRFCVCSAMSKPEKVAWIKHRIHKKINCFFTLGIITGKFLPLIDSWCCDITAIIKKHSFQVAIRGMEALWAGPTWTMQRFDCVSVWAVSADKTVWMGLRRHQMLTGEGG